LIGDIDFFRDLPNCKYFDQAGRQVDLKRAP
jgi:hypothetical protein